MSDTEDLYDEFGNYIGPDLDDDDDDDDDSSKSSGRSKDDDDDASSLGGGGDDDATEHQRQQQLSTSLISTTTSATTPSYTADPMSAIVLHEDKEHYPSAEQVYGDDVRTAVLDEDAMDIDTPILAPVKISTAHLLDATTTTTTTTSMVEEDYLSILLSNETTRTRRGVALVGQFHHGKTCLVDLILQLQSGTVCSSSSENGNDSNGGGHATDFFRSEHERQMSLVGTPLTTLLGDSRGKTYGITMIDCPGHANFHDESVAALRLVDGAVLVVDVVEGILLHTEMALKQAVHEGLPIVLVLTKMDRLILELQLPPRDCYFKLLHLLDAINSLISQASSIVGANKYPKHYLNPAKGNVAFCSAHHGWLFTLPSFAQIYLNHLHQGGLLGPNLSVDEFAKRLWGDCYLDPETRQFRRNARDCSVTGIQRTFVQFVLEPIYKIYSACVAEREPDVNRMLRHELGIILKSSSRSNNNSSNSKKDPYTNKKLAAATRITSTTSSSSSARPLLRAALSQFLCGSVGAGAWVDMLVHFVPCPAAAASAKIVRNYTGPLEHSKVARAMMKCDPQGPLVIHVTKLLYYASDHNARQQATAADGQDEGFGPSSSSTTTFSALGRIYSGTIRPAQKVRVLGESYRPEEPDEDAAVATVQAIAIPRGRRKTLVGSMLKAGNYVLLEGIDATIAKTATIVDFNNTSNNPDYDDDDDDVESQVHIFAPLTFPQCGGEPVVKVAIEPVNPAELPKMVEGLRRISKTYPMARTKVEESGEHVLLGTGELYLDCILHDLRNVYSDIEIKVADPIVAFRETVVETSVFKCFAETANKRNKLTCIAEPLDDGLAEKLELGKVDAQHWDKKKLGRFFQVQYDWDLLSSRSVWAFGDSPSHGTNILMDDTLPSEVDKTLLNTCKNSIVQGFQWAMREGPLCEEPVRATKIKILDAALADKPIHRGGGQIIPTTRRIVHSSLLTATPRLMEPVYRLQILCPGDIIELFQPVLTRRRGHIIQNRPIAGTMLYSVKGFLPVLDSFGFETDLRTFTQGQAVVFSVFDHWAVVPGDPLDRSIILHPLEPSPPHHLARELLVKTRRRKGLSEDVSINKFFDEAMKAHLTRASDNDLGERLPLS